MWPSRYEHSVNAEMKYHLSTRKHEKFEKVIFFVLKLFLFKDCYYPKLRTSVAYVGFRSSVRRGLQDLNLHSLLDTLGDLWQC